MIRLCEGNCMVHLAHVCGKGDAMELKVKECIYKQRMDGRTNEQDVI